MNVAIFASAFYPSIGGVEELVRQLAHEYRRHDISTIVLTNRWPRSQPDREVYEGIPVYRLAMRLPEYNWRVRANYRLNYIPICWEILRILRRHKIDLLHVQCVSSNAHYASIARKALTLPLIVTAQGERTMDARRVYEKSPFMNTILRRVLAVSDHVTACSKDTLTDLEQFFGKPFGKRGSVIYNGIREEDFQVAKAYAHPKPYILGIGRLVPQKGFDVLIQAYARAAIESHDLLIAGEGTERAALESLSLKHGLNGRVHFLGTADRANVAALFKGCSFFALPSRQEPMGIVNLEAMAAGKAVVASRTGGVPEIVIENETGLLVPPADAAALAKALRVLATNAALRDVFGTAGFKRSRSFNWSAIAGRYICLYDKVMKERQSASTFGLKMGQPQRCDSLTAP